MADNNRGLFNRLHSLGYTDEQTGSFEEFNEAMGDENKRKSIFDNVTRNGDADAAGLGTYTEYETKYGAPSNEGYQSMREATGVSKKEKSVKNKDYYSNLIEQSLNDWNNGEYTQEESNTIRDYRKKNPNAWGTSNATILRDYYGQKEREQEKGEEKNKLTGLAKAVNEAGVYGEENEGTRALQEAEIAEGLRRKPTTEEGMTYETPEKEKMESLPAGSFLSAADATRQNGEEKPSGKGSGIPTDKEIERQFFDFGKTQDGKLAMQKGSDEYFSMGGDNDKPKTVTRTNPETGEEESVFLTPWGITTDDESFAQALTDEYNERTEEAAKAYQEYCEGLDKQIAAARQWTADKRKELRPEGNSYGAKYQGRNSYWSRCLQYTNSALQRAEDIRNAALRNKSDKGNAAWKWTKEAGMGLADEATRDPSLYTFGAYNADMQATVNRIKEKQEKGEKLKDYEEKLLEALAIEAAANSYYGADTNAGYRAGQMTAYSLPFIAQMIVTKGVFGGVGPFSNATGWGVLANDLVALAPLQEFTVSLPNVVGDAYDRMSGQATFEQTPDGGVRYTGHVGGEESMVKAIGKSVVSNWAENATEYLGDSPVFDYIGKGFGSLSKRLGFGNELNIGNAIGNKGFAKGITQFQRYAEWSGFWGELGEEEVNNLIDVAIGDMTFDDGENGIFNPETHIEIANGLAPMSLFFPITKTLGYGHYQYVLNKQVNNLIERGDALWQNRPKEWGNLKKAVRDGDVEGVKKMLSGIVTDKNLSRDQRAVANAYALNGLALNGALGEEEELIDSSKMGEVEQSLRDAYGRGMEREDGDDKPAMNEMMANITALGEAVKGAVGEDLFKQLRDNPVRTLYDARMSGKFGEEVLEKMREYAEAKAEFEGVAQGFMMNAQNAMSAANDDVNMRTNQADGMVHPAILKNNENVSIISGGVEADKNGHPVKTGEDSLIIVIGEDGRKRAVNIADIMIVGTPASAEMLKRMRMDEIKEQTERDFVSRMNGEVSLADGSVVTILDNEGNPQTIRVLGQAADEQGTPLEGMLTVEMEDGTPVQLSADYIQQQARYATQKAAADAVTRSIEGNREDAGEEKYKAGDKVSFSDDNGNVIEGTIVEYNADDDTWIVRDANGEEWEATEDELMKADETNEALPPRTYSPGDRVRLSLDVDGVVDGVVTQVRPGNVVVVQWQQPDGRVNQSGFDANRLNELENQARERDEEQGAAESEQTPVTEEISTTGQEQPQESALSQIPVDEQGNPDFEKAQSPAQAVDALVEMAQGSVEDARETAELSLGQAQDALKKIQKVKAKAGASVAETMANVKAQKEAVAEAERKVKTWQDIVDEFDKPKEEEPEEEETTTEEPVETEAETPVEEEPIEETPAEEPVVEETPAEEEVVTEEPAEEGGTTPAETGAQGAIEKAANGEGELSIEDGEGKSFDVYYTTPEGEKVLVRSYYDEGGMRQKVEEEISSPDSLKKAEDWYKKKVETEEKAQKFLEDNVGRLFEIPGNNFPRHAEVVREGGKIHVNITGRNGITFVSDVDDAFMREHAGDIVAGRWKPVDEEPELKKEGKTDRQGNPVDKNGKLITEKVKSIDDLTDEDFTSATRSVELPNIPENVDKAIGADGKPVIIKKNIFEQNKKRHPDVTPEQSRDILNAALYNPDLYGQNQKQGKPYNWVLIRTTGADGRNRLVLLEVNREKDNVEVVHWHFVDERGIEKIKKQAAREGGHLLILPSELAEEAGALSGRTRESLSEGKGTTNSGTTKEKGEKNAEGKSVEELRERVGKKVEGTKLSAEKAAKMNLKNFAQGAKGQNEALKCIYYTGGYAYISDGKKAIKVHMDYPKEYEGKAIDVWTGKEFGYNYPNVETVLKQMITDKRATKLKNEDVLRDIAIAKDLTKGKSRKGHPITGVAIALDAVPTKISGGYTHKRTYVDAAVFGALEDVIKNADNLEMYTTDEGVMFVADGLEGVVMPLGDISGEYAWIWNAAVQDGKVYTDGDAAGIVRYRLESLRGELKATLDAKKKKKLQDEIDMWEKFSREAGTFDELMKLNADDTEKKRREAFVKEFLEANVGKKFKRKSRSNAVTIESVNDDGTVTLVVDHGKDSPERVKYRIDEIADAIADGEWTPWDELDEGIAKKQAAKEKAAQTREENKKKKTEETIRRMAEQREKTEKEVTAALARYEEEKKKNPDAVLIFRSGDGYEIYMDDAKAVSGIIGEMPKHRTGADGRVLEVIAFPKEALETYLPKMIRAGHRVGIYDTIGAKKPSEMVTPNSQSGEKSATTTRKDTAGEKIGDWGEKLEGARKFTLQNLAKTMDNVTEENLVALPLSKVFPRQDFAKQAEQGKLSKEDALFLEAIQSLAYRTRKPVAGERLRSQRKVAEWAKEVSGILSAIRPYCDAETPEERQRIREAALSNAETIKEEDAYRERYKEWNKDRDVKVGDLHTETPIKVAMDILRGLGYPEESAAKVTMPTIQARYDGTYYEIEVGDKRLGYASTYEKAVDEAVKLAKIMRGDDDVTYDGKDFSIVGEGKIDWKKTGRYEAVVMTNGGIVNANKGGTYHSEVFDTREEAERYTKDFLEEAKEKGYKSPAVHVREEKRGYYPEYTIKLKDPLRKSEAIKVEGLPKFETSEDAQAWMEQNMGELNERANEAVSKANVGKGGKEKKVPLSMYYEDRSRGTIKVCMKLPNGEYETLKGGFKSISEAQKWTEEARPRIDEAYAKRAAALKELNKEKTFKGAEPRKGTDWRKGKDITPEEFGKKFGFRGVQFGNWTDQAERQRAMNEAYDAFMDLAEVLGVSPEALSLNGELGIAFGSRGTGWANAHYELADVVINLTKTRGAGSLAHEWWHALDNYFSRQGGVKLGMLTEPWKLRLNGNVRPEVVEAYKNLVKAIQGSDYDNRSMSRGAYWGRMVEETARLFAEWVDKKLQDAGKKNGFLVRGANGALADKYLEQNYEFHKKVMGDNALTFEEFKKRPEAYDGWPEPLDSEVGQFDAPMKALFDTIQEKREGGKAVLFRKGRAEERSEMSRRAGEMAVEALRKKGVDVVTDVEEMQRVLDEARREGRSGQQMLFAGEEGVRSREDAYERLHDLSVARSMENGGKSAYEIKVATGWERGADGLWRYEIPDFGVDTGRLKEKGLRNPVKLSEVIKNADEFFKTYPEMRDLYVSVMPESAMGGNLGAYVHAVPAMFLNEKLLDGRSGYGVEQVMAHELQHAIQYREGFAIGGNTETKIRQPLLEERKRQRELEDEIEKIRKEQAEVIARAHRGAESLSEEEWEARRTEMNKEWEALEAQSREAENELQKAKFGSHVYNELAGEVEARNVMRRRDMSNTQRLWSLAADTEDVSRKDQVVLRNGIFYDTDGKEIGFQYMKTADGEILGFVHEGKVYLDPASLDANTPVHEYTHLWDTALRKSDPKLWQEGVELMKRTPLWEQVKNDPNYKDIAGDENLLASEVHSRLTGEEGRKYFEQLAKEAEEAKGPFGKAEKISLMEQLRRWIEKALKWAKDKLFGKPEKTVEEFRDMPLKDLLSGEGEERGGDEYRYRDGDEENEEEFGGNGEKGVTSQEKGAENGKEGRTGGPNPSRTGVDEQYVGNGGGRGRGGVAGGRSQEMRSAEEERAFQDYVTQIGDNARRSGAPVTVLRDRRAALDWARTRGGNYAERAEAPLPPNRHLLGFYDREKDKAYVIAEEILERVGGDIARALDKARGVVMHERVVHADLPKMLGNLTEDFYDKVFRGMSDEDKDKYLRYVWKSLPPKSMQEALRYFGIDDNKGWVTRKNLNKGNASGPYLTPEEKKKITEALYDTITRRAADEYAAHMSEGLVNNKLDYSERSMGRRLRDLKDRIYLNNSLTDDDVVEAVVLCRDHLQRMADGSYTLERGGAEDAERKAEENEMLHTAMRDRVREMVKELHLGDAVDIRENADGLTGRMARSKGWYDPRTGRMTIILSNNADLYDVEGTIFHEAVAHHGLRAMLGDRFDSWLESVYGNVHKGARVEINSIARKNGWNFKKATEEWLAKMSEDGKFLEAIKTGTWRKVRYSLNDMIRRLGFHVDIGDDELRYALWRSHRNLKEGPRSSILAQATDVAMQSKLQVGNFAPEEEPFLFRERRQAAAAVERDKTLMRDRYERRMRSGWYQSKEALQDSMRSLWEFEKMVLGDEWKGIDEIPDYMNAYFGENRLSSVNEAEMRAMSRLLFDPLYAEVRTLAGDAEERKTLNNYMMAKHGLERNLYMAERNAKADYERRRKDSDTSMPEWDDLSDTAREQLIDRYRRDYAGLTALAGLESDNLAQAEQWATDLVDSYERAHDTSNLWDKVRTVNDAILTKELETGLIDKPTYDKIKGMYRYYIPLRGFEETTTDEMYAYIDQQAKTFNNPLKAARGRTSVADDPFANMEQMAESAVMHGNRNQLVKQTFYNFVMAHPSDLVSVNQLWLEKLPDGTWQAKFCDTLRDGDTPEQVTAKLAKFEEDMQKAAQDHPDMYKTGSQATDIPYKMPDLRNINEHQVVVKVDGKDIVLTVNGNPRLAQAINGKTNPDAVQRGAIGKFVEGLGVANRALSQVYTTWNPDFIMSNFFRDMIYTNSIVWVKESPAYARAFHANCLKCNPIQMKMLLARQRNGQLDMNNEMDRLFDEFIRNGGETGYARMSDIEDIKKKLAKDLKKTSASLDGLAEVAGELGRAVEMAARFAAYVTSRQSGREMGRSIWDAKEISVNFNKKGAGDRFLGETGQTWLGNTAAAVSGAGRGLYVFWNASVQGLTNVGRAAGKSPEKAIGVAGTLFTLGLLNSLLGNGGGDGDDDEERGGYWDIPDYIRRNNFVFRGPGKTWFRIPLPIEFRAVYGMAEILGGMYSGHVDMEQGLWDMAGQFTQVLPLDMLEGQEPDNWDFWQSVMPSSVKPIYEIANNRSWTGMPIYSQGEYNQEMPEWTKAFSNTSPVLVNMAAQLNKWTGGDDYTKGKIDINPAAWQYFLRQYAPTYTMWNELVNTGATILGQKDFDWRNVPLMNRIVMNDNASHERGGNREYWTWKKKADETRRRVNKYEKDLKYTDKFVRLVNSPEYGRAVVFGGYESAIRALNEVINNPNVSDEQKKQFKEQRSRIQKEAVNEMRSMAGK